MRNKHHPIEIVCYSDVYKDEIKKLISSIQQQEFNMGISLNDQPDLDAIPVFYQKNNGNFWIAKIKGTVVGTIGLIDIGNDMLALRKMFVQQEYRGREFGTGQLLLNTVLDWSADRGIKKIVLGTTEKFIAAQRFYEKNNFAEIKKSELPVTFPIMEVDVKFYECCVRQLPTGLHLNRV